MASPTLSNRAVRRHRPKEMQCAYVGIPEAATYLDVATKTVRRLIASGQLPAYRLGNRVLKVKVADLDGVLTPVPAGAA